MKKLISIILLACMALSLAACGTPAASAQSAPASGSTAAVSSQPASAAPAAKPATDPSGAAISLPDTIEKIIVLAPSITETLLALGMGDSIIAIDTQTQAQGYKELAADLPAFDLMTPDAEQLAALAPDVMFVSGMSMANGENPFQPLIDLGVCIVTIPSSESIAGIYEDIAFLGAVVDKQDEAAALVDNMRAEIERIGAIGKTITEKKSVYFEIAAAPYAYSFGSGVFLNEMIELIGATNILADQQSWLSVELEGVVAKNPDVILTNVNYVENPTQEIMDRSGWGEVSAVKNKAVYAIDNMASSLPNHNIVKALAEMAKAVYPEQY